MVEIMRFNATFNSISLVSCRPVLLVEETGIPKSLTNLQHNAVSSSPRREWDSN